jgi:hypothetical protein
MTSNTWLARAHLLVAVAATVLLFAGRVFGQPTYSIDFQGPGAGLVVSGDILTPVPPGVVPPPAVVIPFGPAGLGIVPAPVLIPGFPLVAEVDALSYGTDFVIRQQAMTPLVWTFSVDEFAVGLPGVPFPSVTTEGVLGALEASADVFFSPAPPVPAMPAFGFNIGLFDGNGGFTPFAGPGLNLIDPNPPTPGIPLDLGDNLDALDVDSPPMFPVYFSMDSAFLDPIEGIPVNSGTAAANGVAGGDVVVTVAPGGPPLLYAPALALGLDLFGPGTDDLDALVLAENGIPGYQPTMGPFSWAAGTDMLLYSVRRGSGLIGVLDAIFGVPIAEGDILVPMGPFAIPGIFTPAELLGLATIRSGTAGLWPTVGGALALFNDDLDALDLVPEPGLLTMLIGGALLMYRERRRRS